MITTGAGRLMCENIIHVASKDSVRDWRRPVKRCLVEAETLGLHSIAFPAVGTGRSELSVSFEKKMASGTSLLRINQNFCPQRKTINHTVL